MTLSDPKAQQRIKLAEELWLNYFNRVLFEEGLITESERNRMTNLIADRSSGSEKRRYKSNALRRKHNDFER